MKKLVHLTNEKYNYSNLMHSEVAAKISDSCEYYFDDDSKVCYFFFLLLFRTMTKTSKLNQKKIKAFLIFLSIYQSIPYSNTQNLTQEVLHTPFFSIQTKKVFFLSFLHVSKSQYFFPI